MDYKLFCDIYLYVPSQYVRQSFLKPVLSCLAESWTRRSQQPCSPRLVQLPCHLLTLADFPEKSVSEALSGGALCSCPKRSSEISLQDLGILWKITATKMEDTECLQHLGYFQHLWFFSAPNSKWSPCGPICFLLSFLLYEGGKKEIDVNRLSINNKDLSFSSTSQWFLNEVVLLMMAGIPGDDAFSE